MDSRSTPPRRRWAWRQLVRLLLPVGLVAHGAAAQQVNWVEQGMAALRDGRFADAEAAAAQLTAVGGAEQLMFASYLRGEIALTASEHAVALPHYQEFLRLGGELDDPGAVAYGSLCVGLCLRGLGRHAEALPHLRRGWELYAARDQPALAGRCAVLWADSRWNSDGDVAATRAAAEASRELLARAESWSDWVDATFLLGQVAEAAGETAAGLALAEEALAAARRLGYIGGVVTGLNNLAGLTKEQGDLPRAQAAYEEAAAILADHPDDRRLAALLGNLGEVLVERGQRTAGMERYRQALALAQAQGDRDLTAVQCNRLGLVGIEQGSYDEAESWLTEALRLWTELDSPSGVAVASSNLGRLQMLRGQMRPALASLLAAADLFARQGLNSPLADLCINLGTLYRLQRDDEQALAYFQRAVTLAETAGRPGLRAVALSNIGIVEYDQVRHLAPLPPPAERTAADQAVAERLLAVAQTFRDAIVIFQASGDERFLGTLHNNLALCLQDAGDLAGAEAAYQAAMAGHQRAGARLGVLQTTANLGYLRRVQQRFDEAAELLTTALAESRRLGELEVRAVAHWNLAVTRLGGGDRPGAIDQLYAAIEIIEQQRQQLGGGEAQRLHYLAANSHPFGLLIDLLVAEGRLDEAFDVAERARGRALLEMQTDDGLRWWDRLPAADRQRLRELEVAAGAARRRQMELAARLDAGDEALAAAVATLDDARQALRAEERRLAGFHTELAAATGSQPVSAADIAARLPADTALLLFAAGDETGYVFVLTGAAGGPRVAAYRIADWPATAARVELFRRACATPRGRYRAHAVALWQALLEPALADLPAGIARLVLVPDGVLFDCPFAALVDEAGQRFLSDAYELVVAPSASWLAAALARRPEQRAAASSGVLVVADPEFAAASDRAGPAVARGVGLARLPGTAAEAETIAGLFDGVDLLTDRAAQESAVTARLPDYRLLHFATHGLLDPVQPLHSAIALAAPTADGDDGFLEARELLQLELTADLVTLSACQTGRGGTTAGEGLIGLPWAFFVAGVPTQVVSLWSVSDEMTKELMARFYRHLADGRPPAAALRQAGQDLRGSEISVGGQMLRPAHPYYWAPFVLTGDWR